MCSKRIPSTRMRVVLSISAIGFFWSVFFNSDTFQTLKNVAIREIPESKKLTGPSQMTDSYTIFLGRRERENGIRKCSGTFGCGWPLIPYIRIAMLRDDY